MTDPADDPTPLAVSTDTVHCGFPGCPNHAAATTDDAGRVAPDGWTVGLEQAWRCPEHPARDASQA